MINMEYRYIMWGRAIQPSIWTSSRTGAMGIEPISRQSKCRVLPLNDAPIHKFFSRRKHNLFIFPATDISLNNLIKNVTSSNIIRVLFCQVIKYLQYFTFTCRQGGVFIKNILNTVSIRFLPNCYKTLIYSFLFFEIFWNGTTGKPFYFRGSMRDLVVQYIVFYYTPTP